MLPWWRHVAPKSAVLRLVAVRESGRLVGVAPLFVDRSHMGVRRARMLGSGTSLRATLLAEPGLEEPVARAVGEAIVSTAPEPTLVAFEGLPASSPWPQLFARAWPGLGRTWLTRQRSMTAPVTQLAGTTFDDWLASRSKNFRQQYRRRRRQLEAAGARIRLVTHETEVGPAIGDFARLHHQRWAERGGSAVLSTAVERMLLDVARDLAPSGRFRLWVADSGGELISAQIFLAAGGELSYWLGGFDATWASHQPSLQVIVAALEHAWSVGDQRVDLGAGGQAYKFRVADGEESLEWHDLVTPGRHLPTRADVALRAGWRRLLEATPETVKNRAKRVLGRPVST
jgi:CelD/BcsL family acetyltransferase involved in cellulose biosynthesis